MENIKLVELSEVNAQLTKNGEAPISSRLVYSNPHVHKLPEIGGGILYGIIIDGRYRTCVAINNDEDVAQILFDTWAIPGGQYLSKTIHDWKQAKEDFEVSLIALKSNPDYDSSRPCIEFFKSQRELKLLIPIKKK